MVSVIVPIYNVYDYIDFCVESIVNQTYKDIEILLINDGSTDDSLTKCLMWRKRDARIIVIDKRNEKLGPTRDYGVHISRGEYIVFVDSDDWLEPNYIERLFEEITKNDVDLVCGNYYIEKADGTSRRPRWIRKYTIIETKEDKLCYMQQHPITSMCSSIYKKQFLHDNQISQLATTAQDLGTLVQRIAMCKRMILISEPLYHYREDRQGNTVTSYDKAKDFPIVFEHVVRDIKKRGLFQYYYNGILDILFNHSSSMIKNTRLDKSVVKKEFELLFDEHFPNWRKIVGRNWCVYGSFNSLWTAQLFSCSSLCINEHIAFSSLISTFLGKEGFYEICHFNNYRENAIINDIHGIDLQIKPNSDYIVIDFMDERHNIIETEQNVYITKSEAFVESTYQKINIKREISYGSKRYIELWEKACLTFVEYLKRYYKPEHIFLLHMQTAKGTGIEKKEGEWDTDTIRQCKKIDSMIEYMESFFLSQMPNINYIVGEKDLYFCQIEHPYGLTPYNLNWYLYYDLRTKMQEKENII